MTPQEMIDVITAFRDGKPVETNDGGLDWWPVLSPQFNFHRYSYRVKPPELRPHWPVLVKQSGITMVPPELFSDISEANIYWEKAGSFTVIRLATEYPPVMLP